MSHIMETDEVQSLVYASAYAIKTTPENTTNAPIFVTKRGDKYEWTSWPCMALLFDDAATAMAERFKLGLTDAQVVRLRLQYVAEVVEMTRRCTPPKRRKKVA